MSTLDPAGPGAEPITRVWWVMFWAAMAIVLFMTALSLYVALGNAEHRSARSPLLFVLGGGIVFPSVTLLALLIYGVRSGHALLPLATEQPVYRVEVTAHQWWWDVVYPDAPGGPLHSANEIFVPVGRPIDIHVRSADVIHSFWVPRLGGKIDSIPGRTNVVRLQARTPGQYRGQCAEYCGAQHARMALVIDALGEGELQQRLTQLGTARSESDTVSGALDLFAGYCAECHSLDARVREPSFAPNLGNFSARRSIGAGTLPNSRDALRAWLTNHQELKPGNRMPSHDFLDLASIEALADLLESGSD